VGLWGFFTKVSISNYGRYQAFLISGVAIFITTIIYIFALHPVKIAFNTSIVYPIIAGVLTTLGGITFYKILEKSQVGFMTALTSLYPAITIILAFLILKEKLTMFQGLGVIFALIAGILLSL
jgi:transporter family protein